MPKARLLIIGMGQELRGDDAVGLEVVKRWQADYPGPNDFLGLLLETGASNNAGRWSSADFDDAIADALATGDAAASRAAYDRAEAIVQRDVPVIPVEYGSAWALSRDGLLGAIDNGLGGIRMAGLAWR